MRASSRLGVRAAAEFAVIVLGVLAAFAVEDWSADQADRRAEVQYLTSLAADLRSDSALLTDLHFPNMARARDALAEIAPIVRGDSPFPRDTVAFLRRVEGSYRTPFIRPSPTYEELLATGSLQLVESAELRAEIVGYYQFKDIAATRDATASSGYRELVRSHLPASGVGAADEDDESWEFALRGFGIGRAAAALRQPEFTEAINRHINYWAIMTPTLEELLQRAGELAVAVDAQVADLD